MRIPIKRMVLGAATLVSFLAVGAIGYEFTHPRAVTAQAPAIPTVGAGDLTAAGFTGVAVQPVSGGRFLPPVSYFRVKETAGNAEVQKEGIANLVAVLIEPTPWAPAAVTDWLNVTKDIAGRTSVCSSRPGIYYCVVGPDGGKAVTLIDALKNK